MNINRPEDAERERRRSEILAVIDKSEASLAQGKGRRVTTNEDVKKLVDDVKQRGTTRLAAEQITPRSDELAQVRGMLDGRYEDLKSGIIKPIDGEAFFESLRQREDELLRKPSSR